jgi:outer membrane protein OmpA-like peptidoglycan-associated protein
MASNTNSALRTLKCLVAAFAVSCGLLLVPDADAGWHGGGGWHGGWGCCGWGWRGPGVTFAFGWPGYYPYNPYPYYPPYSYAPAYSYPVAYPYYPPPPSQPSAPPPPQQSFVILFPFDQSILTRDAIGVLDQVVEQARQGGAVQIQVSGYTDSPGTSDYNLVLSERRAQAVRQYLLERGISENQIVARGFGKENPRVPTPEGVREAQNRRVEITVQPSSNVAYGQSPPDCQTVQTTIDVNGQQEPAYGRACRQADGSWKFVP